MLNKSLVTKWSCELIIIFIICLLGECISFYTEATIGHKLKPIIYGDYRVSYSLIIFIGQILLLGLDNILLKEIPLLNSLGDRASAKYILKVIFKLCLTVTFSWAILSQCLILSDKFSSHKHFFYNLHPSFYYLSLASIYCVYYMAYKAVRAIGKTTLSVMIFYSSNLFFLIIVKFLLKDIKISNVLLSLGLSYIIATFIYYKILKVNYAKIYYSYYKSNISYFGNLLYLIFQTIDLSLLSILIILVEILPIDEHQVGIIGSIFAVCNFINIGAVTLRNVFIPEISIAQKENISTIKKLNNLIGVTGFIFISLILVVTYLLTPYFYEFFGHNYIQAIKLMPLALICFLPSSITIGLTGFLNFDCKGNKYLASLCSVSLFLTVLITIKLTSIYGVIGALYGLLFYKCFVALGTFYFAHKVLYSGRYKVE